VLQFSQISHTQIIAFSTVAMMHCEKIAESSLKGQLVDEISEDIMLYSNHFQAPKKAIISYHYYQRQDFSFSTAFSAISAVICHFLAVQLLDLGFNSIQ
jgi:hypothetical protein